MTEMKLVGAICLFLSGTVAGAYKTALLRQRLRILEDMGTALGVLQSEIGTLQRPLPQSFRRLSTVLRPPLDKFFGRLADETGRLPISALWTEGLKDLPLAAEDRNFLAGPGLYLGRYDCVRQQAELARTQSCLQVQIDSLRGIIAGQGRTYTELGAALGAMAAVILL